MKKPNKVIIKKLKMKKKELEKISSHTTSYVIYIVV
jgi:hypothetical protein